MADITKCSGEGCKLKQGCYRYTARDTPYWQAYFTSTPMKPAGDCAYHWPNEDYTNGGEEEDVT